MNMFHHNIGEIDGGVTISPNDFSVLIDSGPHVVFAVNNGELVKNSLFAVQKSAYKVAQDATTSGWMAHTPPPLALPTSYLDDMKWTKWETKYVNGIFIAATLLDRINWLSQNTDSERQVSNLSLAEGGAIRGPRFGAIDTINIPEPWVYTAYRSANAFDKGFELDGQDSFSMLDYRRILNDRGGLSGEADGALLRISLILE